MNFGWIDVDWKSNAELTIKHVIDEANPGGWESMNEILFLHHFCRDFKGWYFEWVPRTTNLCVYASTKWGSFS